jgi:hypothetical protein
MTRWVLIIFLAALSTSLCVGQSSNPGAPQSDAGPQAAGQPQMQAPPSPGASSSQLAADETVLAVELVKSLDSKKLKEGDEVVTRTTTDAQTSDGVVIARGSRVVGHITECKARSKGDAESALGIAFDKVVLRDGKDMPVKVAIQAVGPSAVLAAMMANQGAPSPLSPSGPPTGPRAGSPAGGVPMGGNTGATMPGTGPAGSPGGFGTPPNPSGPRAQNTPTPLTEQSTGVVGLRDLQLQSSSLLVSSGKSVRLDGGTQMILRVQSQ